MSFRWQEKLKSSRTSNTKISYKFMAISLMKKKSTLYSSMRQVENCINYSRTSLMVGFQKKRLRTTYFRSLKPW